MSAIEPIYKVLGQRIRTARRSHESGYTQEQLAALVGLPRSAISAIEGGRQRVLTHTLVSICAALNLSPNEILQIEKDEAVELKTFHSDSAVSASEMRGIEQLIKSKRGENQ